MSIFIKIQNNQQVYNRVTAVVKSSPTTLFILYHKESPDSRLSYSFTLHKFKLSNILGITQCEVHVSGANGDEVDDSNVS